MNNEEMAKVKAALETGVDLAAAHADETHRAYAGYKPERHASVDRDVADMREALAIVEREAGNPASVRDTTASAAPTIEPVAEAAAQADDGLTPAKSLQIMRAMGEHMGEWGEARDDVAEDEMAHEALRYLLAAAPTAQPTPPDDELTDEQIDHIARKHGLDGSMCAMPRHEYWRAFARYLLAAALRQPGALPDEAEDAARYRWLRDHATVKTACVHDTNGIRCFDEWLDEVIDAARALAAKQAGKEA